MENKQAVTEGSVILTFLSGVVFGIVVLAVVLAMYGPNWKP